ncbi:hypothetical protein VTK26DRAFT_5310 [Humicola hyalothermophila]
MVSFNFVEKIRPARWIHLGEAPGEAPPRKRSSGLIPADVSRCCKLDAPLPGPIHESRAGPAHPRHAVGQNWYLRPQQPGSFTRRRDNPDAALRPYPIVDADGYCSISSNPGTSTRAVFGLHDWLSVRNPAMVAHNP